MSTAKKDISKLSFEEASLELDDIINKLDSGEVGLEKAIELYERGNELRAHCESKLTSAKLKIEKITIKEKAQVILEPFEVQ